MNGELVHRFVSKSGSTYFDGTAFTASAPSVSEATEVCEHGPIPIVAIYKMLNLPMPMVPESEDAKDKCVRLLMMVSSLRTLVSSLPQPATLTGSSAIPSLVELDSGLQKQFLAQYTSRNHLPIPPSTWEMAAQHADSKHSAVSAHSAANPIGTRALTRVMSGSSLPRGMLRLPPGYRLSRQELDLRITEYLKMQSTYEGHTFDSLIADIIKTNTDCGRSFSTDSATMMELHSLLSKRCESGELQLITHPESHRS